MHYLSVTWLTWIWATVALYWLAPKEWRGVVLVGITLIFLAVYSPISAVILLSFTTVTYFATCRRTVSTPVGAVAIAFYVAVLVFFKIGQTVDDTRLLDTVVIPLGLSYYTFRCIHFVLERLKGHVPPLPARELVGYLFFLPTIVVGPINRIEDFRRDLIRQRFDPELLSEGAERIVYGYAKIAILSNFLIEGMFGDYIAGLPDQNAPLALYAMIVQTGLNLYFQFSGFSDIAIGFARLLGFRVIENFNWPYLQSNIAAFWRSWHISLSQWCRNYIYGVVVSVTRSPALGALSTMVIIGLWHEISMRFLIWGAYHGIGIIVWQKTERYGTIVDKAIPSVLATPFHWIKVLMTVHFVWFGFVILTAETPLEAVTIFRTMLFSWI